MAEHSGITPLFRVEPVLNEARSASEGRPCYDDVEFVDIIIAGAANLNKPCQRVNDTHRARWPDQYAQFKAGVEQTTKGRPIESWPILTPAMVKELKALEIRSIEDCASLSDTVCQRIMGGFRLRNAAKAYLDESEELAQNEKLSKMNDVLETRCAESERQLSELRAICDQLTTEVQSLRGMQNPIAGTAPMTHDPLEMAKPFVAPPNITASPFAAINEEPRRRGRPPKSENSATTAVG